MIKIYRRFPLDFVTENLYILAFVYRLIGLNFFHCTNLCKDFDLAKCKLELAKNNALEPIDYHQKNFVPCRTALLLLGQWDFYTAAAIVRWDSIGHAVKSEFC